MILLPSHQVKILTSSSGSNLRWKVPIQNCPNGQPQCGPYQRAIRLFKDRRQAVNQSESILNVCWRFKWRCDCMCSLANLGSSHTAKNWVAYDFQFNCFLWASKALESIRSYMNETFFLFFFTVHGFTNDIERLIWRTEIVRKLNWMS